MARTLLVALLLAGLYGCSNDGDSADNTLPGTNAPATSMSTSSTGSTSTAATSAATTAVATSTTGPAITVSDSTASQETSPVDTTPSSTEPSLDLTPPERDELIVAMQEWYLVVQSCLRSPDRCNREAVERLGSDALASQLTRTIDERIEGGYVSVAGPQESYYVILDVAFDATRDAGVVAACVVDGDVFVRVNDALDPSDDEVVADTVLSGPITYYFERGEGGWRATNADAGDLSEGENRCPPRA